MSTSMRFLHRLIVDDDATTAVEYAVMLALILMVLITSIRSFGAGTGNMWKSNTDSLNAVGFSSS